MDKPSRAVLVAESVMTDPVARLYLGAILAEAALLVYVAYLFAFRLH